MSRRPPPQPTRRGEIVGAAVLGGSQPPGERLSRQSESRREPRIATASRICILQTAARVYQMCGSRNQACF